MTAFSTDLETKILNITLRGASWTVVSPYIALFTDVATLSEIEGGTFTNEVTNVGTGYVRQSATFDAPFAGASGQATQNSALIAFAQALATYGNVRFVAVMDSAVFQGGNVMYVGQLQDDKQINTNDTFKFNTGDLDIELD